MSSTKSTRFISFPRFSKTNLNKVLSSKSVRRSREDRYHYDSLEPKNLLSADVGLSFTSVNDGTAVTSNANPPNISAAVGENHIVQFINTGYSIFDKDDGTLIEQGTLEDFFNNRAGANLDDDITLTQPRLVFDSGFDRWYVVAVDDQDLNADFPGAQGNRVFIAGSNTPDPTLSWKSSSIQLDVGTPDDNGMLEFFFRTERVNLSIDEVGLTVSAQELVATPFGEVPIGTAVIGLPQVALFGGDIEANRAEIGRGIANTDIGFEIQFGLDTTIDPQTFPVTSTQSVFSLAIDGEPDQDTFPPGRQGDELILTEFTRDGTPNVNLNLAQGAITRIPIDFYREPDVVRQPTDIIRDRDSALFNASVVQEGRFLYAVHSVRDVVTLADGTQAEGPNAVLRWYKVDTTPEIDPVTGNPILLVDSGVIRGVTDDIDFIDPSIDVSPNGTVAIGYTATGLNLFPSSYVSIGVPSAGIDSPLAFNNPFELRAGEATFIDVPGGGLPNHFFGRYTTTINDPFDPNSFWTFQQFVADDNNWAVQVSQVGPSDFNPVIDVDPANLDNIIEINQVGDDIIEVVVDGTAVGVYDSDGIGTLTVNGNGGVDQFFVNVPDLDAPEIAGSYILVGDGNDTLTVTSSSDTVWQFDGGNGVNINSGRVLGSGFIEFQSGSGDDRFEIPTSNYDFPIFAGAGNDVFVVEQNVTGNLVLHGETGDDVYNLPATSFPGVTIVDSVGSENDQLTSTGTDGEDLIEVGETLITINGIEVPFDIASTVWGIDTFAIDALDGDDTFDITSTTRDFFLFGQRGSDTFNVIETTETTGGSVLLIDGGEGDNSLNVTQNDALIASTVFIGENTIANAASADISFVATGGTFSQTATSTGVSFFGSDTRADVIDVTGVAAGNDLRAYGRSFDDVFIFENTINGTAELLGGAGDDRYETNSVSVFDVVVTDSVDSESDVFVVEFTAGDDLIEVDGNGDFLFNGVAYPTADANFSGVENFALDGLGGNDTFNIDSTTTVASFLGSAGNDIFNVTDLIVTSGETETNIIGGAGTDELNIVRNEFVGTQAIVNEATVAGVTLATVNYDQISLLNLFGSNAADNFVVQTLLSSTALQIGARGGNDEILVQRAAEGNIDLLGEAGSDTFRVEVQGDKTRLVRVIDPAANFGNDRAEVVYTTEADEIVLDGRVVGLGTDSVDIDPTIEVLALEGLGGNDRFTIVSSQNPRVELFGQAGDDIYDILNTGAISEIAIFDSVGSENDTLLVTGTEASDEFVINADSIFINGAAFTSPGGGEIVGVEGFTFDGLGSDDIFRINSTTEGFNYLGSDGNDQFFVTDATVTSGATELFIDGGTGNNELFISRAAILGGAAAGTEIQIEDNRVVGATIAAIDYFATDGIFSQIELNGSSGAGGDVFNDIVRVNTLGAETLLNILALGGNDTIDIAAAAAGDVNIAGGLGSDSFLVELGGAVNRDVTVDDIDGTLDRLDVFFSDAAQTINVNNSSPGERVSYAVGSSTVDFDPTVETLALHALGGDDTFIVTGSASDQLILAGGAGDDTYDVLNVFGDTSVSIIDSVNAENDQLLVSGTNGDDIFEINENSFLINGNEFIVADATNANIIGIESLEVDALDGDDTFFVNSATRGFDLFGGAGNDEFIIHDTAPDAGAADLFIDGGTGVNRLDIQRIEGTPTSVVIEDTFIRNAANSTIQYTATGGSFSGGNGGITIRGLDTLNDAFLVFNLLAENSLELLGGEGNDFHRITATAQGDVFADGTNGRDRYVYFLDPGNSRNLRIEDSGTDGEIDRINTFLTNNSDNVILDGTEINLQNDRLTFAPTIETIAILTQDGDDRIEVVQFDGVGTLQINGSEGNDEFVIDRAQNIGSVRLFGGVGNDTFNLVSASQVGFLLANGNEGDDFIRVGEDYYRNSNLNGADGDDRYDLSFADRGRRSLTVADTGSGTNDTAIIRATDATTRLTLRASGINSPFQAIGTTRQIDSLELIGTEGRDIVSIFAAPIIDTSINTLTGSDILNINSNNGAQNLDIDLGAEPDVANIFSTAPGTTTTLALGRDDDIVNLGSSIVSNNGNLNTLQGELNIDFGSGSDRLNANDAQSGGLQGYTLTDSQITSTSGGGVRNFAGVNYTGAEFLQLQANAQFSEVTVTPSANVRYLLDGNLPQTNQLTITGSSDDGRQLFTTGDFAGTWTFDFFRDIQFEQFAI